jgi:hypothetical protein
MSIDFVLDDDESIDIDDEEDDDLFDIALLLSEL